jgi:hypothetical protein
MTRFDHTWSSLDPKTILQMSRISNMELGSQQANKAEASARTTSNP